MKFIYLDTWALRKLAEQHNSNHAWGKIYNALSTDNVWLMISVIHLFELTHRKRIKRDTIVEYLDKCKNIKWLPAPHKIFKKEVEKRVRLSRKQ